MSETATKKHQKTPIKGKYYSLSPVGNADPDGIYSEALLWALTNRGKEDIKNIAITGPYGSGKSSLIKTFQENYADSDLVFLNISLATFKETKGSPSTDEEMLRLIELSILQQIVYHEKDENIPDSRFKKTKNLTKEVVRNTTIFVFIFTLCLLYQISPNGVQNTLRVVLSGWFETLVHYLTLLGALVGAALFLYRSIRPLRGIQLKKFNFQDAEFAIDDRISKSVLNDHLNELLYFFEVTKYTVVVFEDLDRFEQTEIFTKLRELNLLISNCTKIDRKITFIYAVRDNMFQDTERTKFFDFILPIIPVINSSNSNEILRKTVLENNYVIENVLLDTISLFIDDMRLLYNVMNEYRLYHKKVLPTLDQNKLLAIVLYKNLYPQDFVGLSNNEGELFDVFANKPTYISSTIMEIEKEVEALDEEIEELNDIPITDIHELRKLYILQYLSKNPDVIGFSVDDERYEILDMVQDHLFEHLIKETAMFVKYDAYKSPSNVPIGSQFRSIERQVNPDITYHQRLEKLNRIRNERLIICSNLLNEKQKEKERIHNKSIKELMLNDTIELKIKNEKQKQLVSILLRDGFIDEHYIDFITIFYEGSISRKDQEFLINVKAHIHNDFDYKLQQVDTLVNKIPAAEFTRRYLLNYDLVDYLIINDNYKSERENVLETICDKSQLSTRFLITFLDHSQHIEKFIQLIVKKWPEMWTFLTDRRTESKAKERKDKLTALILEHADLEDIQKLASKSDFAIHCEFNPEFLGIMEFEGMSSDKKSQKIERMKSILTTLNLKLRVVSIDDSPSELVDFVYENNMYDLNEEMLDIWIEKKWIYSNTDYKAHNYSFLTEHEELYKKMLSYIDIHINDYIKKVWSRLPYDANENPISLVRILNNEELSEESIRLIIKDKSTMVISLADIDDYEWIGLLLDAHKIEATWENVLFYYQLTNKKIDEHLLNYMNSKSVSESLSQQTYPTSGKEQEEFQKSFAKKLILRNDIETTYYSDLVSQLPRHFNHLLTYEGLSTEKIEVLLHQKKINVNPTHFNFLRTTHPQMHINLITRNTSKVLSESEKYGFTTDDIAMILESGDIALKLKTGFLEKVPMDSILESERLLRSIGQLLLKNPKLKINSEIIDGILVTEKQSIDLLIDLYMRHHQGYKKDNFYSLMQYWPTPYNEILANGKQVVLGESKENWLFAQLIYTQGFIYEPKGDKKGIRLYNLKK